MSRGKNMCVQVCICVMLFMDIIVNLYTLVYNVLIRSYARVISIPTSSMGIREGRHGSVLPDFVLVLMMSLIPVLLYDYIVINIIRQWLLPKYFGWKTTKRLLPQYQSKYSICTLAATRQGNCCQSTNGRLAYKLLLA